MGKAEIRTIMVPRWLTVLLWIAVSAAMAALIYALSGRAYLQERAPAAEIFGMVRRSGEGRPEAILALLAPGIVDVLFFVPWGALAFLSLDSAGARGRTYILTVVVGAAFALGLMGWQRILPTRVTGWRDVLWNVAGCVAGAMAGHARKRVRVRFD